MLNWKCIHFSYYQPPESPEPWEGVYNATMYGEACAFYNTLYQSAEGTEDCLRLNVDTPSLNGSCKAVMVYNLFWRNEIIV